MNDFERRGKTFITIARRRWKNSETPGSGEQYGREGFTLRNCSTPGRQSWRLFEANGLDYYGYSPKHCVERLRALQHVIKHVIGE